MVTVYCDRKKTIITYWDKWGIQVLAEYVYTPYDGYDGALRPMKPWAKEKHRRLGRCLNY